jgi:large subunit ribosomal protein L16
MLLPKKVKYRKWQKGRGRNKRIASDKTSVDYGAYGMKALTGAWVSARQIEAARRTITHFLKKGGKLWIRIFPDKPRTTKGEVRMGGGKGAVDHYVAVVKPGTILFELDGISEEQAREAFRLASYKLPIKTKMVTK